MILFYVPCKDDGEARTIAKKLLNESLIACGNYFSSKAVYEWKGKLKEEAETILIAKTSEATAEKVGERLKELHSYDTPAIIKINAEANSEYNDWVDSCLAP